MRRQFRTVLLAIVLLSPLLGVLALHAVSLLWEDGRLKFQIEGISGDVNARDVAKSINECLGHDSLAVGRLLRSSRYFSGWWCSLVGHPDLIVTLNHQPDKNYHYYCREGLFSTKIGVVLPQKTEISDIEYVDNWKNADFRQQVCGYLGTIAGGLKNGQRVLFHCDAGRDRTGTVSAIFSALALETMGLDPKSVAAALECDYRKSESLKAYKYGRVAEFYAAAIAAHGSMRNFVAAECGFSADQLQAAAGALGAP